MAFFNAGELSAAQSLIEMKLGLTESLSLETQGVETKSLKGYDDSHCLDADSFMAESFVCIDDGSDHSANEAVDFGCLGAELFLHLPN